MEELLVVMLIVLVLLLAVAITMFKMVYDQMQRLKARETELIKKLFETQQRLKRQQGF